MLQIYDDQHRKIGMIENASEIIVESTLEYSDKKLTFKYPANGMQFSNLKNEYYLRTKTDEYVLKSVTVGKDENEYTAQLNIEEIESKQFLKGFEKIESTVKECLNEILSGTNWNVNGEIPIKKRTIRKESKCTAWDLVKDCVTTFRVEIEIDSIDKKIILHEKRGSEKGAYFIEGLNLKNISKKITTYDFFNVLIPYGKDGIGIDVLGKNYIENLEYTKKRIVRTWIDERYTNTTSLLEDAKAKLEESSKPVSAFTAEVINLAKQKNEYNIIDFAIGDSIELISNSKKIRTTQRIVKMKEYLLDNSKNTVELSNVKQSFAEIQKKESEVIKQEAINVSNGKTKEILKDYPTREETETKIVANAEEIILESKKIFTEKSEMTEYFTKEETTSAITVATDNVEISASKKYQTSEQVNKEINGKLEEYSTTVETESKISATAEQINISVSKKIDQDEIISSINVSNEKVKINAEKIEMTGVVTFTDLKQTGSTEINANNITSGVIKGVKFIAGEIDIETDAKLGRILYLGKNLEGKKGIKFSENSAIYFSDSNLINVSTAFLVYPKDPLGQANIPYLRFISDIADDYFYNGIAEMAFTFGGASADRFMGSFKASMDGDIFINCKNLVSNKGLSVSSDISYKKNLEDIEVKWIEELEILKYDLVDGSSVNDIGIRANDYENKEYAKYFLSKDIKGKFAVDYKNISIALVKYVQELEKRVTKLEEKGAN